MHAERHATTDFERENHSAPNDFEPLEKLNVLLFQNEVSEFGLAARAVIGSELVLGNDFGRLLELRLTVYDGEMFNSAKRVFLHETQEFLACGGKAAIIAAALRLQMHFFGRHDDVLISIAGNRSGGRKPGTSERPKDPEVKIRFTTPADERETRVRMVAHP